MTIIILHGVKFENVQKSNRLYMLMRPSTGTIIEMKEIRSSNVKILVFVGLFNGKATIFKRIKLNY